MVCFKIKNRYLKNKDIGVLKNLGRFHPYFSLFINCHFSKEWYHNVNASGLVLLTSNQNYNNSPKKVNHKTKSNKKTALFKGGYKNISEKLFFDKSPKNSGGVVVMVFFVIGHKRFKTAFEPLEIHTELFRQHFEITQSSLGAFGRSGNFFTKTFCIFDHQFKSFRRTRLDFQVA